MPWLPPIVHIITGGIDFPPTVFMPLVAAMFFGSLGIMVIAYRWLSDQIYLASLHPKSRGIGPKAPPKPPPEDDE